jgi:predicted lipoprotein with Yx(FWY)xxD motif
MKKEAGMHRLVLFFLAVALTLPAGAVSVSSAPAPVTKIRVAGFGNVLARRDRQALYYWQVEKRAGGKIRCVGTCATLWPPLLVRSAATVPRRVPEIKGTFGVIRRPNGKLQVTHDGLPVYTYVHEGPGDVRCDNVNGWFVVRV